MLALQRTDQSRPLTPRNSTTEWELLRNGERVAVIFPVKPRDTLIQRVLMHSPIRRTVWEARTQEGELICRDPAWVIATNAAKAWFAPNAPAHHDTDNESIQDRRPAAAVRPTETLTPTVKENLEHATDSESLKLQKERTTITAQPAPNDERTQNLSPPTPEAVVENHSETTEELRETGDSQGHPRQQLNETAPQTQPPPIAEPETKKKRRQRKNKNYRRR